MFNITRAIIYAWRAGQRPHNLDQWAELACSTTLRLVPYGVYLVTLYLNASWNERFWTSVCLSYSRRYAGSFLSSFDVQPLPPNTPCPWWVCINCAAEDIRSVAEKERGRYSQTPRRNVVRLSILLRFVIRLSIDCPIMKQLR